MTAVETITRGMRLTPKLWAELDRRRRQHGSFEAAFWAMVQGDGAVGREPRQVIARSARAPLLKPSQKEKGRK